MFCFLPIFTKKALCKPSGNKPLNCGGPKCVFDANTLTITGFDANSIVNCSNISNKIKKKVEVIKLDKITEIADNSFAEFKSLLSINMSESVIKVGARAFLGCSRLANITLPSGVTNIGANAFESCGDLTKVILPEPKQDFTIEASAFKNCFALENINLPSKFYTSIEAFTFMGCQKLASIAIPESVTKIGEHAFECCSELTSITLPKAAEYNTIADSTFKDCKKLEKITLPGNVHTIGPHAFENCKLLSEIAYTEGQIKLIQAAAFDHCEELTTFKLPEDSQYTTIVEFSFRYCVNLTEITIPKQVKVIGNRAFESCNKISTINFAQDSELTTIEYQAFDGCNLLKNGEEGIVLPTTVTTIGDFGFSSCKSLVKITMKSTSEQVSVGASAFKNCNSLTSIELPTHLKIISNSLFSGCSSLESVILPADVENIGKSAFENCKITKITLPTNKPAFTSIEQNTFNGCEYLTTINFPITLKQIGRNAFFGCKALENVEIPSNIEKIGGNAFANCTNLKKINYEGTKNPGADSNIILHSPAAQIYVTFDYTDDLFGTENVIKIGKTDEIDLEIYTESKELKLIGSAGHVTLSPNTIFTDLMKSSIEKLTFSGITTIGEKFFSGFTGLNEINLPVEITTIESNAFDGCTNLNVVSVLSINTVATGAFANCNNIHTVNILGSGKVSGLKLSEIFPGSISTINSVRIGDEISGFSIPPFSGLTALTSIHYMGNNDFSTVNLGCDDKTKVIAYLPNYKHDKFGAEDINKEIVSSYGELLWKFTDATKILSISGSGIMNDAESESPFIPNTAVTVEISKGITTIGNNCFKGFSALKTINIPTSINTIGSNAFSGCSSLETITIPSGVTTVGANSFEGCSKLTNINYEGLHNPCSSSIGTTIPDTLQILVTFDYEGNVFGKTNVIKSGNVPTPEIHCTLITKTLEATLSVEAPYSIPDNTDFTLIKKAKKLVIGEGITSIGVECFNKHTELNEITIPLTVENIGNYAFQGCSGIEKIIFSGKTTITTISEGAFRGCRSLIDLKIPSTVTTIKTKAFQNCVLLKNLILPDNAITIEDKAFDFCNFSTVSFIPSENVNANAFANCYKVNTINILGSGSIKCLSIKEIFPDSVHSIETINIAPEISGFTQNSEFALATGLKKLESIYYFGKSSLAAVDFNVTNTEKVSAFVLSGKYPENAKFGTQILNKIELYSYDKLFWHFNSTTNVLGIIGMGNIKDSADNSPFNTVSSQAVTVEIPEGITTIGNNCFKGFSALKTINIPTSINTIGSNAFSGCSSLETITIPSGVTTVGANSFEGCSKLTTINYDGLHNPCSSSIGTTIPDTLQILVTFDYEGNVFGKTNVVKTTNLRNVMAKFNTKTLEITLDGKGKMPAFSAQTVFAKWGAVRKITINERILSICNNCFKGLTSLEEVIIPNTVSEIGDFAFCGCAKLEKITFISNTASSRKSLESTSELKTIGNNVFQDCTSLKEIEIPEKVTEIGAGSFQGCKSLTKVEMPKNLETIGENTFQDCSSLKEIEIPENVTEIGAGLFQGCKSLTKVEMPKNLEAIGENAFKDCASLKEIEIPEKVNKIGAGAFNDCKDLKTITYKGTTDFSKLPPGTIPDTVENIYVSDEYKEQHGSFGGKETDLIGKEVEKKSSNVGLIVGISIGAVVLIAVVGFCIYWFALRKPKSDQLLDGNESNFYPVESAQMFVDDEEAVNKTDSEKTPEEDSTTMIFL